MPSLNTKPGVPSQALALVVLHQQENPPSNLSSHSAAKQDISKDRPVPQVSEVNLPFGKVVELSGVIC